MGSLRDEYFENLDYLSQITEIIVSPEVEIFAKVPERIDVDINLINKNKRSSWTATSGFEINVIDFILPFLEDGERKYAYNLGEVFEFQVSEDVKVDLENGTLTGSIAVVKNVTNLDERWLLRLAVDRATDRLRAYRWNKKTLRERIVSVLNTLESGAGDLWIKEDGVPSSSRYAIQSTLESIILENKWRIRNCYLIEKMAQWIEEYLSDPKDTNNGLVNLFKLKMMVNRDLPIYSVDEVKNA